MVSSLATSRIVAADEYLAARTGSYELREQRYNAVRRVMDWEIGLDDTATVVDVGAGWTELDAHLRTWAAWRGRYIPVDACIDGVDLDRWVPPRSAEFFVALEVLEHLEDPARLVHAMKRAATRAVIVSTPNPHTTDVLGMDATHRTPIYAHDLTQWGFGVSRESFYGQPADSLFGVWRP